MKKTLKTRNGAEVEVHFEGEEAERIFNKLSSKEKARFVEVEVSKRKNDTGKGTKMHFLVNDQGYIRLLTMNDYSAWLNTEEPDWFHHEERRTSGLAEILPFLLLPELFGAGFGPRRGMPSIEVHFVDALGREVEGLPNGFHGPSEEFLDLFEDDEAKLEEAQAVFENDPENCAICLHPDCPGRHDHFDQAVYEAAVKALKQDIPNDENGSQENARAASTEATTPPAENTTPAASGEDKKDE